MSKTTVSRRALLEKKALEGLHYSVRRATHVLLGGEHTPKAPNGPMQVT